MLALFLTACLVVAVSGAPHADDYQLISGLGYYKVIEGKYRWSDGMISCYFDGGHLAVINSEEEAMALKKLMEEHNIPYYTYIGFSDLFEKGYYITVQDQPLSETGYTRWEGGIPPQYSGWQCGALSSSGDLTNRACDEMLSYICEIDITSDYQLVPGIGYYKVHSEDVTWGEAVVKCNQEGTKLAVLNSDEEAAAIVELFQSSDKEFAHVGVHDRYYEAFYSTVDGGKVESSGYNKWTQFEPYKTSMLNNVAVDHEGLYHLMNSTIELPFICEKKL